MGISGLLWSKIFIHSRERSQNLFVEKIEFDSGVFHNLFFFFFGIYIFFITIITILTIQITVLHYLGYLQH